MGGMWDVMWVGHRILEVHRMYTRQLEDKKRPHKSHLITKDESVDQAWEGLIIIILHLWTNSTINSTSPSPSPLGEVY